MTNRSTVPGRVLEDSELESVSGGEAIEGIARAFTPFLDMLRGKHPASSDSTTSSSTPKSASFNPVTVTFAR